MKKMLQIFAIFAVTILFLSIEMNNKPIFGHIYNVISPATRSAQNATEKFFGKSVDQTQHYSKKLFDNSVPRLKDSVKSKMSSKKIVNGPPQEDIPEKDRSELDDLIKKHK